MFLVDNEKKYNLEIYFQNLPYVDITTKNMVVCSSSLVIKHAICLYILLTF